MRDEREMRWEVLENDVEDTKSSSLEVIIVLEEGKRKKEEGRRRGQRRRKTTTFVTDCSILPSSPFSLLLRYKDR